MEKHHCNALVRYIPPAFYHPHLPRARNVPPLTFFSLPREIRDRIYHYALVSKSNIIICKGTWKSRILSMYEGNQKIWPDAPTTTLTWREVSHEATSTSLSTLSIKLLFCSKVVSHEAAIIFYNKNTFAFEGDHNWDPVVHWLKTIGTDNRNYLAILEVCGKRPDQVWQNHCGERFRIPSGYLSEEAYPKHPYFAIPIGSFRFEGYVDNINPIVEEVFVLLGQRLSNEKVTIVMQTGKYYPGGVTDPFMHDGQFQEDSWYSMDLPNLIEKFLELHCTRSMKRSVEVVWKGVAYKRFLETEFMENLGWNISTSPAENEEVLAVFGKNHRRDESFARYTLRRKKLTGPIIIQRPMPMFTIFGCRFAGRQVGLSVEPKRHRINARCCLVQ